MHFKCLIKIYLIIFINKLVVQQAQNLNCIKTQFSQNVTTHKKTIKTNYYIELLREEIEKKFSKRISVSTTIELSDEIEKTTCKKISPTTLQRFFEIIANKSQPSKWTLNILSEYVGYNSWNDLQTKNKEELPISNHEKLITDEFGITLFKLCLKNHHFETVLEYLDLLPNENLNWNTQLNIANSLGSVLRKDKKARAVLLPQLAKTKVGRTYFYESFVDIDYVNQYYQDAISSYYLPRIEVYDQRKYVTDYTFAKAIEFIAHLKVRKRRDAILTASELFQKVDINTPREVFIHPFPYARLIAIYIISEYLKKKLNQQKIDFAIEKIEEVITNTNQPTFLLSQLIMALNYCNYYQEIIDLFKKHESIIEQKVKTSSDYLPIIVCVKNAFAKLGITTTISTNKLDYSFLDIKQSSQSKPPVI